MGLFSGGGGCGNGRGGGRDGSPGGSHDGGRGTCPRRASREKCPCCGSASVVVQKDYWAPSPTGGFFGLAGVNMMPISIYRCEDCDHIWEGISE